MECSLGTVMPLKNGVSVGKWPDLARKEFRRLTSTFNTVRLKATVLAVNGNRLELDLDYYKDEGWTNVGDKLVSMKLAEACPPVTQKQRNLRICPG